MAIERGPNTWGSRKTVADKTYYRMKGQQLSRGRRAPGQSNPSPQFIQAQGTAAGIWEVRRQAAGIIALGFTLGLQKQGRPQRFYKYTWDHGLTTTAPPSPRAVNFDASLLFSRGNMAVTPMLTTVFTAATNILALTWNTEITSYGKRDEDRLAFFARNGLTNETYSLTQVAARIDGAASITFPTDFANATDPIDIYTAFIQNTDDLGPIVPGTGLSSDSQYNATLAV